MASRLECGSLVGGAAVLAICLACSGGSDPSDAASGSGGAEVLPAEPRVVVQTEEDETVAAAAEEAAAPRDNRLSIQSGAGLAEVSSVHRSDYAGLHAVDEFPESDWCSGSEQGVQHWIDVQLPAPTELTAFAVQLSDGWTSESPTSVEVLVDDAVVGSASIPEDTPLGAVVDIPATRPVTAQRVRFRFGAPRSGSQVCVAEVMGFGARSDVPTADFAGLWYTGWAFASVQLRQDGLVVEGCNGKADGTWVGTVDGNVLHFEWDQASGAGIGAISLQADGTGQGVSMSRQDDGSLAGALAFDFEVGDGDPPCELGGAADDGAVQAVPTALERDMEDDGRATLHGILFDTDSARLKPSSTTALDAASELLSRHPDWSLSVEGHTDDRGGEAHNQDLSERRAASVVTALVERGVDAGRLEPEGFGESRPIADNATTMGRAQNRRVELVR